MKMPAKPPSYGDLLNEIVTSNRMINVMPIAVSPQADRRYWHWDKLRFLTPPAGISLREWWWVIKMPRSAGRTPTPLIDVNDTPFSYTPTDHIVERLHQIDRDASGRIEVSDPLTNPETKKRYIVNSLIEEAITSSQLEGAATTRNVAQNMIRANRAPRDRSERMILNNYKTMQHIAKVKDKALTVDLLLEIQALVCSGTLDDATAAGRFRHANERIDVADNYGNVFHVPPPADALETRVSAMCDFANGKTRRPFIHPVLRSIILHFWLAYDHPFVDGNGRTARALFYWSMLHQGYWLCEFISISEIIRKGPSKYGRAFLYTETDDNDLTYFILYHLNVIHQAVEELHSYVERKAKQLQAIERELRGSSVLNHRQRALVGHALRHPHHRYTIESHRASHTVVYETARKDLMNLAERGLFNKAKIGREWNFTPVPDLEERLREAP